METNKEYGNEDIQHWDWHEHLRKRPGMYLGKLGDGSERDDGLYVLFKEIVDNAVDEFNMGFGKTIDITLDEETKEVERLNNTLGIEVMNDARCFGYGIYHH